MNTNNIEEEVLCVDLDRTLVKTDILLESVLVLFRTQPWRIFLLPFWLLSGKAYLKTQLASRVDIDVSVLPYNEDVIEFIRAEKSKGRNIVLVTATNRAYAEQVAEYLGLFSEVISSDEEVNLKSTKKRKKLDLLYGEKCYDYIGDSSADIVVWQGAKKSFLVGSKRKNSFFESRGVFFDKVFSNDANNFSNRAKIWIRALRIHQWAKNILIFVPLFLSYRVNDQESLNFAVLAFFSFSIAASASYLINDFVDLELDRKHPTKKNRPFACGDIFIGYGVVAVFLLFFASFLILQLLPLLFSLLLGIYLFVTILYSLILKKLVMVDVIILALLYTMRIVAGAFAISVDITFWLLSFSMFIFLSLALAKRYAELELIKTVNSGCNNDSDNISGRGYKLEDLPILRSLGSSSGLLAVLMFALYINSPEIKALYHIPEILWLFLPVLLFWISRVWLLVHRGDMHEDPVVFALHDKVSLFSAFMAVVILSLAANVVSII